MSNIKSRNSRLAKLFLLGCANAAILATMPQTVMAVDIEIRDNLRKVPEYQALTPADKLDIFIVIQANENFGDLFNDLMPEERRLFNAELKEGIKTQADATILNGAKERREARINSNMTANLISNQTIETGRIEQEMAMDNKIQILEILAKSQGVNALAVRDKTEKAIHFNNIEKLKYVVVTPNIDAENNLKAITEYTEVPLTKEAFEHTFFGTNITDANVASKDVKIDYFKVRQSPLLKNLKKN